jgi:hypothetical protein
LLHPREGHEYGHWPESFVCHADPEKPELFVGTVAVEAPLFRRGAESVELAFALPAEMGEIVQTYLFCAYEPIEPCCHDPARAPHDREPAR